MKHLPRALLVVLLVSLGACVQTPPSSSPGPGPVKAGPNHPHFAPPPGVASQWDSELGVYRVTAQPHLYYRARTFYRWDSGWSWSTSAQGPWTATDNSGVPPALSRRYMQ